MRILTALAFALAPVMGVAQGLSLGQPVETGVVRSAILVIDFERVFAESAFGQRVATAIEEEGQRIAAENRQIEAELVDEERRLTERRATMDAADFRVLAEEFDEKVQRLRREQDEKGRALGTRSETGRRVFAQAAQPVLGMLMQEAGAAVILERRAVFVAADAIEVTDLAIERIDAAIGAGEELDATPPTDTDVAVPETTPTETEQP